jgi:hypothetical protein
MLCHVAGRRSHGPISLVLLGHVSTLRVHPTLRPNNCTSNHVYIGTVPTRTLERESEHLE